MNNPCAHVRCEITASVPFVFPDIEDAAGRQLRCVGDGGHFSTSPVRFSHPKSWICTLRNIRCFMPCRSRVDFRRAPSYRCRHVTQHLLELPHQPGTLTSLDSRQCHAKLWDLSYPIDVKSLANHTLIHAQDNYSIPPGAPPPTMVRFSPDFHLISSDFPLIFT